MTEYDEHGIELTERALTRREARRDFLGRFSSEHQPDPSRMGRTSPVVRYKGVIADAERVIVDHLPDILWSALQLATGQATEEVVNVKTGAIVERRLPPDQKAIKYLIDRIAGTPINRSQMEVSGEVRTNGLVIHLTPQGLPAPEAPPALEGTAFAALPPGDWTPRELSTAPAKEPTIDRIDNRPSHRTRRRSAKIVKES